MSTPHFECAIIGDWHLAFITAASLSALGRRTLLVNPDVTAGPEFPELAVSEPGLKEAIEKARAAGTLDFRAGITKDWSADLCWLAIDTPVNENDEVDVSPLLEVAAQLRELRGHRSNLVISSQIPLGFSRKLQQDFGLEIVYIPENLRLGKGLETFLNADRTVIGADQTVLGERLKQFLSGLNTEFLLCDLMTAEMIKHATNAFLATSISFANELARLGEKFNVDTQAVGRALKMDKRIGRQAYVAPGLGFAGGTLPRDLRVLQRLARDTETPVPLVDAVLAINESTTQALVASLKHYLGTLDGKRLLLVGYTYKAETDTLRRSLTIELAKFCSRENAIVGGFDPALNDRDLSELSGSLTHYPTWKQIDFIPDAIVVMTPRESFKNLDWKSMKQPDPEKPATLVLDARGILDSPPLLTHGLAYKALWQPVQGAI